MLWLRLAVFFSVVIPLIMDSNWNSSEAISLRSLGFHGKPNAVSPPPIPSVMWRIYNQSVGNVALKQKRNVCFVEEFNVPGTVIRVFPDQGRLVTPSSRHPPNLCLEKRLYFDLSIIEKEEQVTMGRLELRFSQNTYYGQIFDLQLYMILQVSLKGMGCQKTSRKLLFAQTFRLLHKSLYFNLKDICRIWRNPLKNLGLSLEITHRKEGTCDECQGVQTFLYTSLLAVSLNPRQCMKLRKKRSSRKLHVMANNICNKRRLYIDFKDVGWEKWVIAPRGFFANYCSGECPSAVAELLNGSNHAIMQSMVHSRNPKNVPLPCCVPTQMSSISILFYDNSENVVLRQFEDMTVEECGCR